MNKLDRSILCIAALLSLIGLFVPAASVQFGGTTNYDALDVSDGYLVDGSTVINGSGNWTGTGTFTVTGSFTPDAIGSAVLTLAATTTAQTLTAANICDNSVIDWPTTTSTGVITLPTAVALQADCLDTMGSYRDVIVRNTDSVATSSFTFTAGASSTVITNFATSSQSTGAVLSGQASILRFVAATSTASNATMVHVLTDFFR